MKILIIFCAFFVTILAEVQLNNKHYTQHESSVTAAKQSLQERISQLEGQSGSHNVQYGHGGSQRYVAGCSTCVGGASNTASYSSRLSSSSRNSGHEIDGSDYVGVGVVGHSNDAHFSTGQDDEDVQINIAPSYIGTSSSQRFSSNAHEADDMQQRQVPGDLSTIGASAYRLSSASATRDEDDLQRNIGANYQPNYSGTVSRTYSQRRKEGVTESSRSGSIVPVYSHGGSESSLRSSSAASESDVQEHRVVKPVQPGQYVSISTRPRSSTVLNVPIRVDYAAGSADQQQQFSRSEHQSGSELSGTRVVQQPGYRVAYYPANTYSTSDKLSSRSDSESGRTFVQQPEKYTGTSELTSYGSYRAPESSSQTRHYAEGSQSEQTRVAPVSISYPSEGGSSRVATSGSSAVQRGHTQTRVVPVYPANTVESSSSSSRTAEEREQRRFSQSRPTHIYSGRTSSSNSDLEDSRSQVSSTHVKPAFVVTGRNSGTEHERSSQYGNSGSTTYYSPISTGTRTQTQYQAGTGSQTQYQAGTGSQTQYQAGTGSQNQFQRHGYSGYSPYVPGRASTYNANSQYGSASTDNVSQRFGTGATETHSDDLNVYMSESEKLARRQQQQVVSSSSNTAVTNSEANRRTIQKAANLDSAASQFVSSNSANRNSEFDTTSVDGSAAGTGGYKRVKSWQKQSKWASGSQYGTDGQPKSYSMLSTAESEKHNINGNEAAYKAATTTLEDDGRVSTYTIHKND